jgi:hypothetical protein
MKIIGIVTGVALGGALFVALSGAPASAADSSSTGSPADGHGANVVAGTRVTSDREYSVNDREYSVNDREYRVNETRET